MQQQIALITGAASGIGRELALAFAQNGYAVAAIDCCQDGLVSLAEIVSSRHGRCAWRTADVTQPDSLQDAVGDLEQQLGPIDLLIANAGIGVETSALDLRVEDIARVIQVNLLGVVNSVGAVLPGMLQRRRGHLVAISSVASFRGVPFMLAYCASKAGVNAFMEGLRVEVRPFGVHVTTICPGWIRTPMTADMHDNIPYILEVDAAARHIIWAIEKKRKFYAFPRRTDWFMRFLGCLPWAWQDAWVAKMVRDFRPAKQSTVKV